MNTGNELKDARSRKKLAGVHPKLHALITAYAKHSQLTFIVTEGLRTPHRQAELVKAGASQTMKSKHLTGRAVDLAVVLDGEVRWDTQLYVKLGAALKAFAQDTSVRIIWGGDWTHFHDYCHFELGKDE